MAASVVFASSVGCARCFVKQREEKQQEEKEQTEHERSMSEEPGSV
jgi:hypothetical protein